uniref:Uncharacterized protein n=1 Tax=Salix viminalis TaxID=40686 RepID=A0A6N2MQP2_SALVM
MRARRHIHLNLVGRWWQVMQWIGNRSDSWMRYGHKESQLIIFNIVLIRSLCPHPQSFCVVLAATVNDTGICRAPTLAGMLNS